MTAVAWFPDELKTAIQLNAQKPAGGWRPLSMVETTAKFIDAIFVKRKLAIRKLLPPGAIYSAYNLGGEKGYEAATEVLYLNIMVIEDHLSTKSPLLVVSIDYPKFFNTL